VLDLEKLESGRTDWQVAPVDMKAVIEDSVNATSQLFLSHGVTLETRLPAHVPRIVADRDRLVQVLINLLSNAAKFVRPVAGHVDVELTCAADRLCVAVTDNGPGISIEDQQIIFEKFRQAGDAMIAKPEGTGLGLPISREIIEHFGGRIWVHSAPGKGATFAFDLPLGGATADARTGGTAEVGA
jgi:signal transduction histidine kinase